MSLKCSTCESDTGNVLDVQTGRGTSLSPGDGYYCQDCGVLNIVCSSGDHMHPATVDQMKQFGLNKVINLGLYNSGRFN